MLPRKQRAVLSLPSEHSDYRLIFWLTTPGRRVERSFFLNIPDRGRSLFTVRSKAPTEVLLFGSLSAHVQMKMISNALTGKTIHC